MSFASQFATATAQLLAHGGVDGSYAGPPPTNPAINGLRLLLEEDEAPLTDAETGETLTMRVALIQAQSSALTPAQFGVFAIGADAWMVRDRPVLQEGLWQCRCIHKVSERANLRREKQG